MPYNPADLSVLAYANNFTLWHYVTRDPDIAMEGYFNKAAQTLRENDLIIANVDIDETPKTKFYIVSSCGGNKVAITAYP